MRIFTVLFLVSALCFPAQGQETGATINFKNLPLRNLLEFYASNSGVGYLNNGANLDQPVTVDAFISRPLYTPRTVEEQIMFQELTRPIVSRVLKDLGIFSFFEGTTLMLYPRDRCSAFRACAQELARYQQRQKAADEPPPVVAPPPQEIPRFESWNDISGKKVFQKGTASLDAYSNRYGLQISRAGYFYTGDLPIWSSNDPYADFGGVVDVETRYHLSKMGAVLVDNEADADVIIRGWYATAAEDVSGGGFNGQVAGGVVRVGGDIFCRYSGWGKKCDVAQTAGDGAGAVLSTVRTDSRERYAAVEIYQEVMDSYYGRQVFIERGTGSGFVKELESKEALGFYSYAIEHNNAQPIARAAALDVFTPGESPAAELANAKAENTSAKEGERTAKVKTDTAGRR